MPHVLRCMKVIQYAEILRTCSPESIKLLLKYNNENEASQLRKYTK